jgi:hypothetical protein
MLRQIRSLISNCKNWFTNDKEAELEENDPGSDKYTWPGPDLWYQGPLEVFTETEAGPQDYQTDQET